MKNNLFTKDFTLLWLGKSVSQLGDGAGFIGLMWWVSQTGSATTLGLMAAVSSLVRVGLSPFSGALADRISKKAIIVSMDICRGLVYLAMGYLAWVGQLSLFHVIALSAVNTVFSVFFGPAISSSIPLIVEPENLPKANSFMQMTGIIVQIVSYTAGGVLVAFIGAYAGAKAVLETPTDEKPAVMQVHFQQHCTRIGEIQNLLQLQTCPVIPESLCHPNPSSGFEIHWDADTDEPEIETVKEAISL